LFQQEKPFFLPPSFIINVIKAFFISLLIIQQNQQVFVHGKYILRLSNFRERFNVYWTKYIFK